jgi:hypothetical protein
MYVCGVEIVVISTDAENGRNNFQIIESILEADTQSTSACGISALIFLSLSLRFA